jgi:hypothetical protein
MERRPDKPLENDPQTEESRPDARTSPIVGPREDYVAGGDGTQHVHVPETSPKSKKKPAKA